MTRQHCGPMFADECGECRRPMPWNDDDHELAAEGVVPLCRRCWWRLCGGPIARIRNWWISRARDPTTDPRQNDRPADDEPRE